MILSDILILLTLFTSTSCRMKSHFLKKSLLLKPTTKKYFNVNLLMIKLFTVQVMETFIITHLKIKQKVIGQNFTIMRHMQILLKVYLQEEQESFNLNILELLCQKNSKALRSALLEEELSHLYIHFWIIQ